MKSMLLLVWNKYIAERQWKATYSVDSFIIEKSNARPN